mmetsp:Transcript_20729/g.34220  ORF Transcript_20729/g.34220 Transcript_20729/m.34220 type:complete len:352 (-) Transcript_20729:818-1873(-)|eukprot:CAMPEP_0203754312 /NCGR_PEP_ID=MMETSP0098-20131031/7922_1 /ASSEMBLY_ACC=CAM_ASM_000208 /TAXON_ID=96639 /ORGANISM=" , Strain NY0313808BC1" /LENGTH=351 /DNA_ID=CAMNT_0050645255 /DNA_START=299 /DNA_END=1354 /DNA_ORIENTATION=+
MTGCKAWEKGEDCSWNQRTARITLLPVLIAIFVGSVYVTKKLKERNREWLSRPVRCMLCVSISQACDIIEHFLVLTEMRENGYDWYANSMIDALGDIFLMYSLYLFGEIWCDNILILAKSGTEDRERAADALVDIPRIRAIYKFIAVATVPLAGLFAMGSIAKHYDQFMILYVLWGVVTGVTLLTPVAFMMQRSVHMLPKSVRDRPVFSQLSFMAKIKLYEQATWNFLMVVTIVCIIMFLQGGNKSATLIGIASVAISVSWIVMHLQVILFFITVTKAGVTNPVFDHTMLESLMDTTSTDLESDGAESTGFARQGYFSPDKLELSDVGRASTEVDGDTRKVVAVTESSSFI